MVWEKGNHELSLPLYEGDSLEGLIENFKGNTKMSRDGGRTKENNREKRN